MSTPVTRASAIAAGAARLTAAGIGGAEREARLLYRWASGLDGARLQAFLSDPAGQTELDRFEAALTRREARQPVSHITGTRAFWGRDFHVTGDVLDPRPDSETLIAEALRQPAAHILDLGTGSGCLLLTLLAEMPGARGVGVDISEPALRIARENAAAIGVEDRAALGRSDWFGDVADRFDLIVSNPPYLTAEELAGCQPELRHEPEIALCPGGDGLDAYRTIAAEAAAHATPDARLLLEIGERQGAAVSAILERNRWQQIRVIQDLDGRDRVVAARAPSPLETDC